MKYPLVYIEWVDHIGDHAWTHEGDIKNKPYSCNSVGWLFRRDKTCITIVGSLCDDNDTLGNYQTILCSCITKFQILTKKTRA